MKSGQVRRPNLAVRSDKGKKHKYTKKRTLKSEIQYFNLGINEDGTEKLGKKCQRCRKIKSLDDYYYDKIRNFHDYVCKPCAIKINVEGQRLAKYGVSKQKYQEMLSFAKRKCEICFRPSRNQLSLSVDHCHYSKKVRGLLCHQCNVGIGYFQDNPKFLLSAIRYLKKKS